jgi:hypothetical protein
MEKETLKRIFDFLEEKEQQNPPFLWKHINNIPLTEEDLNIKGNLNLSFSKIESLPKGLKVGGDLDLVKSESLTFLPDGLKVGGDLYLHYSKIESLPEGLKVSGRLFIGNTPLTKYSNEELREMVKSGFIKEKIVR